MKPILLLMLLCVTLIHGCAADPQEIQRAAEADALSAEAKAAELEEWATEYAKARARDDARFQEEYELKLRIYEKERARWLEYYRANGYEEDEAIYKTDQRMKYFE